MWGRGRGLNHVCHAARAADHPLRQGQDAGNLLQETSYKDREYIAALMHAEGIFDGHDVRGYAANIAKATLLNNYPAECECIALERQKGIYTSPEKFRALKERVDAARWQEQKAAICLREDEERRHYARWLEQGGRP